MWPHRRNPDIAGRPRILKVESTAGDSLGPPAPGQAAARRAPEPAQCPEGDYGIVGRISDPSPGSVRGAEFLPSLGRPGGMRKVTCRSTASACSRPLGARSGV